VHDTCGVNNLHGMPGILAALCSAIICAVSTEASWIAGGSSKEAYADVFSTGRTPAEQGGYQILCLVISWSIAVVGGVITGYIVKYIDRLGDTLNYLDSASWEVPELEIPFFFDRRGEINRDMLKNNMGGDSRPAPAPDNATADHTKIALKQATGSDIISNELLNMKLDLILQSSFPAGKKTD